MDKGARLLSRLRHSAAGTSEIAINNRVFQLYLPVYSYFLSLLQTRRKDEGPLFIGISAAQGSGKTTLTSHMVDLFAEDGKRCVIMSLDDFYLTFEDQRKLAVSTANPLLQYRGNAGSHDLALLMNTLSQLRQLGPHESLLIPRYNKSLNAGRGDREPESRWQNIEGRVDVVLFEGWMLGFSPRSDLEDTSTLLNSDQKCSSLFPLPIDMAGISQVNELLRNYHSLHVLFDAWLVFISFAP
jgi:D-glycerate 3-kinase